MLLLKRESHLQEAYLGEGIWKKVCYPVNLPPYTLGHTDKIKKLQGITLGNGLVGGLAERLSVLLRNHLQESTPSFLSGFTSIAFSVFRIVGQTEDV